jgi:hypothetical protein
MAGTVTPASKQQALDVDEGRHVFALGRGVHRDQGVAEFARSAGATSRRK